MACFLIPAGEAVVTTIIKKAIKNHEMQAEIKQTGTLSAEDANEDSIVEKAPDLSGKIRLSEKIGWLNKMLWCGSGLLAFEHLWHGEISPFFPFLTAAVSPADAAEMLREMATNGVGMAALVTAVWGVMVAVAQRLQRDDPKTSESKREDTV